MVTCNECGASNRTDAQFCAQCDAYLAWVDQSSQSSQKAEAEAEADTDPVRADAAARKPPNRPSRPVSTTPRRPVEEQPAEQRQVTRQDVGSPGDDAGVGAVRPAEPKQRVKKQYAADAPRRRPGVDDLRTAARTTRSVTRMAGVGGAGVAGAGAVPGGVLPPGVPHPASLRGSLNEARVARGFGRQMRAAAGGRRVRYDRGLTTRVILVRTILASLALLVLVVLASPMRTSVRAWGDRQLDRIIPGRFQDIAVASVTVEPAGGEEVRGFLTSYAVDGQPGRAWAMRTDSVPGANNAGAACAGIADRPALVARFDQPTRVDRITIQAGLNPESPDRLKQARPRVVDLLLSNGQCLRQDELPDSFEPFNIAAPGAEIDSVKMQILDVYPASSGAGDLVAVSEISFSQR